MVSENETLRWPTNLGRDGIESRLAQVREAARAKSLANIVALFENLPGMAAPQLGAHVVEALTWLQDKPEHRAITTQVEMVALNLKNLK